MVNIYKKKIGVVLIVFLLIMNIFSLQQVFAVENEQPEFNLTAKSALLMEANTGEILYSKNKDKQLPPASMTKIMTMLLIMEAVEDKRAALDDVITVSEKAASMGGSQVYLEYGEKMSLKDLLKAIAISSANDASVAAAEYISGTEGMFVKVMNDRAKELGMKNTYFYNTNGLPPGPSNPEEKGNLTTAYDLALLTRELIKHPKIFNWTSTWIDSLRDGEFVLNNTNKLVRHYHGANGLKTGYTSEAKYCLTATAKRNRLNFITVIMGAESSDKRFNEAVRLLNYGFNIYDNYKIVKKNQLIEKIDIWNARNREVEVLADEDIYVPVRKGSQDKLKLETTYYEELKAPLEKEKTIGKVKVFNGEIKLGESNLILAKNVEKTSFFKLIFRIVVNLLNKLINIIK